MNTTIKKIGSILLLSSLSFFANAETTTVVTTLDVDPQYPASALRRNKSGHVSIRFDVNENGRAHNISVVDAYPDSSFNSAALKAVRRSRFVVMEGETILNDASATNVERIYRFSKPNASSAQTLSMN